jgi:hypothetical protein
MNERVISRESTTHPENEPEELESTSLIVRAISE